MIEPFSSPAVQPENMASGALLALGVERRVLRACLLEPIAGSHRLAGWISVEREPAGELTQQLAIACRRLGARLGRTLWDEEANAPFTASKDPIRVPALEQVLAAATPHDLLRVWVAGLTLEDSVATAATAVNAAPARVVGHTALSEAGDGAALAHAFAANRPDVLVITGGYDNLSPSRTRPIYQLCRVITDMLRRLPPGQHPLVVYAGDRWMAPAAVDLLHTVNDNLIVEVIDNLRPTPTGVQTAMLAALLTEQQWQLVQRMPGFIHVSRWVIKPARVMSLENNFIQTLRAWMEVEDLPQIHGLYFASNWRLHVLAAQDDYSVRVRYVEDLPADVAQPGWPPVTLVSGLPPGGSPPLTTPRWWDRSGMLPVVAAVGQVAPQAMIHALRHDLLAEPVNELPA